MLAARRPKMAYRSRLIIKLLSKAKGQIMPRTRGGMPVLKLWARALTCVLAACHVGFISLTQVEVASFSRCSRCWCTLRNLASLSRRSRS